MMPVGKVPNFLTTTWQAPAGTYELHCTFTQGFSGGFGPKYPLLQHSLRQDFEVFLHAGCAGAPRRQLFGA